MKLIINIPDEAYELLKSKSELDNIAESIIANGIPYNERPQSDECMTNACYKKQNAKHCNTCLHYQQLTKIQEIGYCETKNYHVSANSNKCTNYKEKQ